MSQILSRYKRVKLDKIINDKDKLKEYDELNSSVVDVVITISKFLAPIAAAILALFAKTVAEMEVPDRPSNSTIILVWVGLTVTMTTSIGALFAVYYYKRFIRFLLINISLSSTIDDKDKSYKLTVTPAFMLYASEMLVGMSLLTFLAVLIIIQNLVSVFISL